MTSLQEQFMNTTAEMHSAQDGITAGVITALVLSQSPLLPIVAVILGFGIQKSFNKFKLARAARDLLRIDDIRSNPEYFVIPYVLVSVVLTALMHVLGIYVPAL